MIDDDQLKDYQEDIELYIDTPTVVPTSDIICQSYRNISASVPWANSRANRVSKPS